MYALAYMLANLGCTIKRYWLPLLSGILIGTSYAPFPPWASVFCLVPLWLFWLRNQDSLRRILLSGWLSGFLLTMIGFNWVAYTAQEFGHFPWPVAFLILLIFAAFANLQLAFAGAAWWTLRRFVQLPRPLAILLLPLLTALANAYMQIIFHWNFGYSFYWIRWPMYQVAELIGFQGLSSLVIVINYVFLLGLLQTVPKQRYARFAAALAIFALLNLVGFALAKSIPPYDARLRFAVIQANIGNLEKQVAEKGPMYRDHIFKKFTDLTSAALASTSEPVDFVIWPETAFPATIYPDGEGDFFVKKLKQFVASKGVPLITGGYAYDPEVDQYSNSMFIVDKSGQIQKQVYKKTHLLAFGEYVPFGNTFPILREIVPAGDFLPGPGPHTLDYGDLKIGPQICYEGLYPHFSVELARQGTHVLVNLTNDSWFGSWQEPFQHMTMTFSRGVELRRPVVRSTNTGITAVSLADGTLLEKSPLFTEWFYIYDVPFYTKPRATVYQQFPWLMDALFVFLLLMVLVRGYLKNVRKT